MKLSSVNHIIRESIGRFSQIEEDEEPAQLLVSYDDQ